MRPRACGEDVRVGDGGGLSVLDYLITSFLLFTGFTCSRRKSGETVFNGSCQHAINSCY